MQSQTKMQASPAFADDVLTTLDSPFQSFYNHVVSDKNTSSCKPSDASNHNTSDSYEPPVDADRHATTPALPADDTTPRPQHHSCAPSASSRSGLQPTTPHQPGHDTSISKDDSN